MKWIQSGTVGNRGRMGYGKRVCGAFLAGVVLSVLCCGSAMSQVGSASPQVPDSIPPFDIVLTNGRHFNKSHLKKGLPVMVVYFDPTCSHCQEFARLLSAQIDRFKAGRIVLITFVPLAGIMDFALAYHLDKPWVILGTEDYTLVVQKYYQVRQFPVIALYDRQGKQIRLYREKYPEISFLHDQLFGKNDADVKPNNKIVTYPAPPGERPDHRYKVSVDARNVAVYTARIAANDKADAFKGLVDIENAQKYFDTAAFGYFDLRGRATVTVTVPSEVSSVKILPASAGITATIHGRSVYFPVSSPQNLTIEINGEWVRSLHLFINPLETNVPAASDTNVIYFGPGLHTISHLIVGDNKTVYVAGGAIVRAVIDSGEKYTLSENGTQRNYVPSISLRGRNITIRGRGIIDAGACPTHTRNLLFIHGQNINIEGVILRDPSTWTVPIRQSDSVTVDNIKIFGYRPNSDGIDICNSRYVTVKNCFIRTMDDLIVIKADKGKGDSKHIVATKCVLWNQIAHALSIGAEVSDNVDDVAFTDCDVIHDKGREWSLRIYQCNAGYISHVRFENIRIAEAHKFISLWIGKAVWSSDKEFGHIQGITFKNITAVGTPLTVDLVGGDAQHAVKDVVFQNVLLNGQLLTQEEIKENAFVSNVAVK